MPRRRRSLVLQRARALGRRLSRSSARAFISRRFAAFTLASFGLVLSLNLAVRACGAEVHPLSLTRVSERAIALGFLLAHRLRCDDAALSPERVIAAAAERHGVSPRLALAVARTESGLVHTRISAAGAMGLMQLMPATAQELGVRDPFALHDNADGGVRYLAQLMSMYRGDVRRALAAYNAGMGRVPLRGARGLPRETRTYVGRVLSAL